MKFAEFDMKFQRDLDTISGELVAHYQKIEKEFRRSGKYKFADSKESEGDGPTY